MTKLWSIERAQGAVRAAFFTRAILKGEDPTELALRYSDIRATVSGSEGRIGDRTLSRSLRTLQESGKLKRTVRDGKPFYSLLLPKADVVASFARAEGSRIERLGGIGGWGDPVEGWSTFGVPAGLPRHYRSDIRRACIQHQSNLDAILESVWDDAIKAVLNPARGRVPRRVYSVGRQALESSAKELVEGIRTTSDAARVRDLLELELPGALKGVESAISPSLYPAVAPAEAIVRVTSILAQRNVDEVRQVVTAELDRRQRKAQRLAARIQPLWDVLSPREMARASSQLQLASALTTSLTSVVHA